MEESFANLIRMKIETAKQRKRLASKAYSLDANYEKQAEYLADAYHYHGMIEAFEIVLRYAGQEVKA